MAVQPSNFHVGDAAALPGSQYDDLPEDELIAAIKAAHKLKTGRAGNIRQTSPPPPKRIVDLTSILGGL
jgi:hypothetical protein